MATSMTVRVSAAAHALLQEMAERSQTTIKGVVEEALAEYRARLHWQQVNQEIDRLRDEVAGSTYLEVEIWDGGRPPRQGCRSSAESARSQR